MPEPARTTQPNDVLEERSDRFSGYVWGVHTGPTTTTVQLRGKYFENERLGEICILQFPPNDPRYLAEIIRAQNNPHFRIHVSISLNVGATMVQSGFQILLDYTDPKPIPGSPPFDVVEIAEKKEPTHPGHGDYAIGT